VDSASDKLSQPTLMVLAIGRRGQRASLKLKVKQNRNLRRPERLLSFNYTPDRTDRTIGTIPTVIRDKDHPASAYRSLDTCFSTTGTDDFLQCGIFATLQWIGPFLDKK
jgi:hypothetical protein